MRRGVLLALLLAGCGPADGPPDPASWFPSSGAEPWSSQDAGDPIFVPQALAALEGLDDVSRYGEAGLPEGRSLAGAWGLGNGAAFGLVGLDDPWNTLTNHIGPGYQRHDGFFGDSALLLVEDGEPLAADAQAVQRVRGGGLVRTLWRSGELSLSSTDTAVADAAILLRHVTVRNEGAPRSVSLRVTLARAPDEVAPASVEGLEQVRGDRALRVRCEGGEVSLSDTLDLRLPELGTGEEWSGACWYLYSADGTFPEPPLGAVEALADAQERWQTRLAPALELDTPDPSVSDLYEGLLVTLMTQTSRLGIVSPMHRYTSGWLRDSEGPVRLYLRAGLYERAAAILEAHYEVAVVRQSTSNSFPLDEDVSDYSPPEAPTTFWAQADFMPGREPAEAPSYPALLHALYYRASGDDDQLDAARLAWLRSVLLRQELSPEGLLPFSGDETFRFSMALALGGMPEDLGWSANSSFLLAAAAQQLGELAAADELLQLATTVRAAAEDHYWLEDLGFYAPLVAYESLAPYSEPFEDVSTQPLWTGYGEVDEQQRRNVDSVAERLMDADGLLLSSYPDSDEPVPGHTGMVPGFWLANLAEVQHVDGELAFHALDLATSPSGNFGEGHGPDHRPQSLIHDASGLGSDSPARYRPWEGGIVAAAMLQWLVGDHPDAPAKHLRVAPHLPTGWPSLEARGLRLGEHRYDLRLEGYAEGRILTLTRGEGGDPWTLHLELPGQRDIAAVWVDGVPLELARPARVVHLRELQLDPGSTLQVVVAYGDDETGRIP